MKAGDIMTRNVVTTSPDVSKRSVASILARHGISAVPVVDDQGTPIGMISEGDLMPRNESEREARRDWWLKALAEGEDINPEFIAYLSSEKGCARDFMVSPVITVDEKTDVVEVAELLSTKKIKRVPVMRDGRMVGIVSRADLVNAIANKEQAPQPEPSLDRSGEISASLETLAALTKHSRSTTTVASAATATDAFSAAAFRELVMHHEEEQVARHEEERAKLAEAHLKDAREMLAAKLSDKSWQRMLRSAHTAAQNGEREQLLLRFPCELCTDHGRAINAPDASWPATLRGLAAEVFSRWKKELQPHGFGLVARVLEFPDDVPGDIGLFLEWGK